VRDNLTTNTGESKWKSSDKSNMKGITSSRNHVAKAASGYLKHSTGVGLDVIRIAQTTGAGLPPSIISRAIRKRTQHAQGGSCNAQVEPRVIEQKERPAPTQHRTHAYTDVLVAKGKMYSDSQFW
jgi:hypothetical protein